MTAAIGLADVPVERTAFYLAEVSGFVGLKPDRKDCAQQIKQVLRRVGLTMAEVSALTRVRYGKKSPYFVPPTFLYKQKKGITPHICQIASLSQVTGYRFADWLDLCGFDLEMVLPLQLKIHTERTAIVTPRRNIPESNCRLPLSSKATRSNRRYVFAKIGSRDAVVYPRLLPGSIVRADRFYPPDALNCVHADERLWLVEYPGGITCCHVKRVDNEHVVLLPNRPPLSSWPLRLSSEARILGLVDLEVPPRKSSSFKPMCGAHGSRLPPIAPYVRDRVPFSKLLRISRSRAGLTLRAAHEMTIRIARLLGNRDYCIALGLLSDYEAMNKLPRHVPKILSLCVVYGIDPFELLESAGVHIDDSEKTQFDRGTGAADLRRIA